MFERFNEEYLLAQNTRRAHYEDGIVETVHTELETYKPEY